MADRVITDRKVADHRLSQISTASSTNSRRAKAHVGPWQLGRTLGRGSSGRVRLAKHTESGRLAAVKIVPKAQPTESIGHHIRASDIIGIEREVIIMKLIEHPNIMGLFDVWENKGELYLVLEYIEGGELFDYLISRGRLSEREAIHYFRQICYGVDYCHQFNICHRDLKPENLLLDKNRNIKIADFGMAALEANGRLLETSCGSPHYASPEIVSGKTYHGAPSDIWSCGIILFALLTGHLPFDDENIRQLLLKVQAGKFSMPMSLSAEARDLISRMLVVDPMERIRMREILEHPLLQKYPPRHLPAESLKKKMPQIDVTQRITYIDREILRNLQTLWPHSSRDTLIAQLRKPDSNTEKIFYSLLVRFRQRHGLSSRESLPKTKSITSIRSMKSSKSTRSISSITNNKTGAPRSVKSLKSVRSSRSLLVNRKRRSPTKTVKATAATSAAESRKAAAVQTVTSTNKHEHTDMFAQILDQAFNSQIKTETRPVISRPDPSTGPTEQPSSLNGYSSHRAQDVGTSRLTAAEPAKPLYESAPRNKMHSTNREIIGYAASSAPSRSAKLNLEPPKLTSLPTNVTADHDDTFGGLNVDFDFTSHSLNLDTSENHNFLLPMIFEEDRFADTLEEAMDGKIYNRPQLNSKSDNREDTTLTYEPSAAAAAISAPVRQAPKAPSGPREMPGRKSVPVKSDHLAGKQSTAKRMPLATLNEEDLINSSRKVSVVKPGTDSSSELDFGLETKPKPSLASEPITVRKRTDASKAPPPTSTPAPKEKGKSSWIRRLTPILGSLRSSSTGKEDASKKDQDHSGKHNTSQGKPNHNNRDYTHDSAGRNMSQPPTRANSNNPSAAPDRTSRGVDRAVNKENVYHQNKTWSSAIDTPSVARANTTRSAVPVMEEPSQNWFMKMLFTPTQPAFRELRSSCQPIELRAVILEILSEWTPHGLAVYNDGSRGDPISLAVLRSNSLRLKSVRITIDIKSINSSTSLVKLLHMKGSRTSFAAFSNELTRRLQEGNLLYPGGR